MDRRRHAGAGRARRRRLGDPADHVEAAGRKRSQARSSGSSRRLPTAAVARKVDRQEQRHRARRARSTKPSRSATASRPSTSAFRTRALLPGIRHAGSVFIGPYSPEAAGDYASGPNHVLPTRGAARLRGGLSVADYVKVISVQEAQRQRALRGWPRDHDAGARRRPGSPRASRRGPHRCQGAKLPNACGPAKRSSRWRPIRRRPAAAPANCASISTRTPSAARPQVIEFLKTRLDAERLAVYPEYGEAKRDARRSSSACRARAVRCSPTAPTKPSRCSINTYVDDGDDVVMLQPVLRDVPLLRGGRRRADPRGRLSRRTRWRSRSKNCSMPSSPTTRAILISNPTIPPAPRSNSRASSES